MGHLERRLGRPDVAEKHYRAAEQLDPRNLDPLFSLAELLSGGRRFADAEKTLEQILTISPDSEEALAASALNFQDQGRLADSAAILSKISPHSQSFDVTIARQQQLIFERRFGEAIARIKSNVPAAWANDPRTIAYLGYLEEWVGHKEEARAAFLRAIAGLQSMPDQTVPVDARILPAWLARAYAGLGEKDKALDQGKRAVTAYKNDALSLPAAETGLAQIQARFGDADSAIAALPHLLEGPGRINSRSASVSILGSAPQRSALRKNRLLARAERREVERRCVVNIGPPAVVDDRVIGGFPFVCMNHSPTC